MKYREQVNLQLSQPLVLSGATKHVSGLRVLPRGPGELREGGSFGGVLGALVG